MRLRAVFAAWARRNALPAAFYDRAATDPAACQAVADWLAAEGLAGVELGREVASRQPAVPLRAGRGRPPDPYWLALRRPLADLADAGVCAGELIAARVGDVETGPGGVVIWRLCGVRNSAYRPRTLLLTAAQQAAVQAVMAAGRRGRAPQPDEPLLSAAETVSPFTLRDKLRQAGKQAA